MISTDSAGQAWSGRQLPSTGFDSDDGRADESLRDALERQDEAAIMAALPAARVLVPLVAVAAEVAEHDGHTVEKTTDMALATLTAPDGQRALPVFSDTQSLQRWDGSARPSPVSSAKAAQAAIAEACDVMVIDVGSPTAFALRPSMLWALAQARDWLPAYADPFVVQAVSRACAAEDAIVTHDCTDGADAGELRIALQVRPGLNAQELQSLAQRIGERVATDGEARARIDAVAFAITQADQPPSRETNRRSAPTD